MTPEIRAACYDEIRNCMKDGVTAYYRQHSDRLDDARSKDAIQWSLEGLECIFTVLDKYELRPLK